MQYVTKFINVIGSYYGEIGINSAYSTGATDIIVIEQSNGNLLSTPFHVRFGKLNLLRPKEVIVDLYLNNEYVKEIEMRVEPTGEAYFELQEDEDTEEKENVRINTDECSTDSTKHKNIDYTNNLESWSVLSESFSSGTNVHILTTKTLVVDYNDPGYKSSDESEYHTCKKYDLIEESKLSLCGGLKDLDISSAHSMDKFLSHLVQYEDFSNRPNEILNNPNLVILFNNKFMDWKTFSFVILARLAYKEKIPEDLASNILQPKKAKSNYCKWIPWGYSERPKSTEFSSQRNMPLSITENLNITYNVRMRTLSGDVSYGDNNNEYHIMDQQNETKTAKLNLSPPSNQSVPSRSVDDSAVHFNQNGMKRTNILPSEKLKLLKLNEGVNELVYVITGKYRGTIKVGCKIYLWNWSDRLVISDIDGTITKSDVRGQLAPWLGLDWTQSGIVKLYNSIQKNYFRFIYLSARAIGQADQTRQYLENVNQQGMYLPDGPLLLAPSSLIIAFKKEVIEKNPEEFKIKCLEELKSLFPISDNPYSLYAGFGNKPSDELTYKTVGIKESKIFTVNKKGEVHTKALLTNPTDSTNTYDTLYQLVDYYFPTKDNEILLPDYSTLTYWGNSLLELNC